MRAITLRRELDYMDKTGRIHSLDSIRGVSSVIVVIFHCVISFPLFYNAYNYQEFKNGFVEVLTNSPLHTFWAGPEAVLVFFVLSGFVLSLPFLKDGKDGPTYGRYVVKRICRIYIPYIVLMIFYTILITSLSDYRNMDMLSATFNNRWDHPITLKAVVSAVFMMDYDLANINGVVWSLIHEMRISIIFPIIIYFVKILDWKLFLPLGLGLSLLTNDASAHIAQTYLTGNAAWILSSFGNTMYYVPFFIIGAGFAKYRTAVCARIIQLKGLLKLLLLFLSVVLINFKWVFYGLQIYSINNSNPKALTVTTDWITALGIVLLFAFVLSSAKAEWFLTRRIFIWLGKISYSLYLVHVAVIMLCARYLSAVIPLQAAILAAPLIALPIASVAYKFIEKPAMELGKRLTAKSR